MTATDRLVKALDERGHKVDTRTASIRTKCPGHDGQSDNSLSLRQIEGQALVHCFGGCDTVDVLAALGLTMSDLFDEPRGPKYTYTDALGKPTRVVHRKPDKTFPQSGDTKGRPQLYRLPAVVEAVKAGTTIYLVEGEKDVHAIESVGAVATTTPMGASNLPKADLSPLSGAQVVVVPDNDKAGETYLRDARDALRGLAASVRVARTKVGKDAADHVAAGYGLDDLVLEPTYRPPSGAELLDQVEEFLGRFVAYPSEHARIAHTLWIVHAHLMAAWESTPRIAFLSPEPGSGKSRALEVTELLVPRPVHAVNTTPAYLFRKVSDEAGPPTILYDEIDTVFGPKAKDNEDIRGMLNAGHRRGATAGRCVVRGKIVETEELPAYCAVALAGIGDLPDTILSRSVIVRMQRRAAHERVEPFRHRVHRAEGHRLRDHLADWAGEVVEQLTDSWPEMPAGIEDRNADVWEALLAVADVADEGSGVADGTWPKRARVAAVALVADSQDSTPSLGIRLLEDLREIFDQADSVALHTDELLTNLRGIEDGPWSDLKGKSLDARGLAYRLRKYQIKPANVRNADGVRKGYRREDLHEAWSRYLPDKSATSATSATPALPYPSGCAGCGAAVQPSRAAVEHGWPTYCRACDKETT